MGVKRVTSTDSVVDSDGVTKKDGVTEGRSIAIGDNSSNDKILLESGDFVLLEDNSSRILRNIEDGND